MWCQLQQELPHGKIEPPVNRVLEIGEHLPERPRHDLWAKGLSAGHAPGGDGDAQGVADGFSQNAADLAVRHRNAAAGKVFSDILPVKEQVVGLQRGHQAGILERRQISGRRAPGEKHEAFGGVGADQLAQRLTVTLRREHLKIVNEQDIPPVRKGGKGKIRRARVQPQHIPSGEQSVRQRGFSKAAGRAEKEDAPALHKAVKPLLNRRLHNHIPGHVLPPFWCQGAAPLRHTHSNAILSIIIHT